MDSQHSSLETLQDIKRMMERSSRFISLSGMSGIAAGICALTGAWFAHMRIAEFKSVTSVDNLGDTSDYIFRQDAILLLRQLVTIAALTFGAAFISAFIFTYLRSKKNNIPIWGLTAQRLLWNVCIPLAAGGLVVIRMIYEGYFDMISPACLIFYGLALVHASKYTLGEVRWLGYGELVLGLISLWVKGYGIYFWAAGFGVLHIIYGFLMWWRYERGNQ